MRMTCKDLAAWCESGHVLLHPISQQEFQTVIGPNLTWGITSEGTFVLFQAMTGRSYIIEIGIRPILLHMISYHFSYVRMWEILVKALKWPQNTKDCQTRRQRNDNTGRIPTKTGWTWQKVTVTEQATYVRDKVERENRGISISTFLRWCLMRFW